jgi:hypothetical protein
VILNPTIDFPAPITEHRAPDMYEHRTLPLLPRREFFRRLLRSCVVAAIALLFCLGIGMVGYHHFENLPWVDAFANAAMILSGMGPMATLQTEAGKIFAGCYALFSGLAFITIVGVVLAPVAHRFLHKFHLEDTGEARKG